VGKNPTFVAAALTGNHRLTPEEAATVGKLLDLDQESTASLSQFPVRADFPNMSDPFKYRLLEVIGVYGDALREMANEMFGDGIMSAIDFSLDMDKVKGSQGEDRFSAIGPGHALPLLSLQLLARIRFFFPCHPRPRSGIQCRYPANEGKSKDTRFPIKNVGNDRRELFFPCHTEHHGISCHFQRSCTHD